MRLLDTSVAVDHLRDYAPATEFLTSLLRRQVLLVGSELMRFELLAGFRPDQHATLDGFFFGMLTWIPVTEEIARRGGELVRTYRPSHSGIDDIDFLLAATAVVIDAPLLTRNVRHFPMFPGLQPPY